MFTDPLDSLHDWGNTEKTPSRDRRNCLGVSDADHREHRTPTIAGTDTGNPASWWRIRSNGCEHTNKLVQAWVTQESISKKDVTTHQRLSICKTASWIRNQPLKLWLGVEVNNGHILQNGSKSLLNWLYYTKINMSTLWLCPMAFILCFPYRRQDSGPNK